MTRFRSCSDASYPPDAAFLTKKVGNSIETSISFKNSRVKRQINEAVKYALALETIAGQLASTCGSYTALVRTYGLQYAFITPNCPQQNSMVESVMNTLKEQFANRHRFESLQHVNRAISDWISFLKLLTTKSGVGHENTRSDICISSLS